MSSIAKSILIRLEGLANISRVRGHSIWMQPLSEESIIVDLGGNQGDFSNYFYDCLRCHIFCVEANPELAVKMALPVEVDNLAITSSAGTFDFVISDNPEGSSLFRNLSDSWGSVKTVKIRGVPLQTYLDEKSVERVSLLKIDIEGAELDLLDSLDSSTLQSIDQLTVEFHDFIDPSQLPLVKAAISKLEKAGFLYIGCNFPHHDDTLFIRKSLLKQSKYWKAYLSLLIMKQVYILRGFIHQFLYRMRFGVAPSYEY
ncbi:MAG: FkbM family methyltransferase [Nodosilinea sp.]